MWSSNLELLRRIKEKVYFILFQIASKSLEKVVHDPILCRAILRSLEIIGEASKKIDPDLRGEHPEIEWKKMAGTRDRVIHDYFWVDYEIIWDIIKNKPPDFIDFVNAVLENANSDKNF